MYLPSLIRNTRQPKLTGMCSNISNPVVRFRAEAKAGLNASSVNWRCYRLHAKTTRVKSEPSRERRMNCVN
jgi:hypothetical protein